jgi:chromosome segregation ATPase
MDLHEIKNRITELLFGTTAPSGQIWTAIHEIEDQYKAEIKKLQEDLHFAVDDVIAGKVEIAKLRDDLEKIQDSLDDSEAENGNLAEECGRLEADLEAAQREIELLREKIKAMQKVIERRQMGNAEQFCEGVNAALEIQSQKGEVPK